MPLTGPVSEEARELLRFWIQSGAPEDGTIEAQVGAFEGSRTGSDATLASLCYADSSIGSVCDLHFMQDDAMVTCLANDCVTFAGPTGFECTAPVPCNERVYADYSAEGMRNPANCLYFDESGSRYHREGVPLESATPWAGDGPPTASMGKPGISGAKDPLRGVPLT